jgi:hypothetical protein
LERGLREEQIIKPKLKHDKVRSSAQNGDRAPAALDPHFLALDRHRALKNSEVGRTDMERW